MSRSIRRDLPSATYCANVTWNPRTEGLPKCFASAEASSIGACIGLSDAPFFFLFLFYSSVTKGAV